MSDANMEKVRYVILHFPGPAWQTGVDFREQPGAMDHAQYNAGWFEAGKMEMGGPYLTPDSGGMMIPTADMSEEEVEAFAAADPAVASGLLTYEVRPWYVAMDRRK